MISQTDKLLGGILDLAISPPARPSVGTPSPYEEDNIDRRYEKFGITRYTDPVSYESESSVYGSDKDPKPYSGPLNVSAMVGSVADNFTGMPKSLGMGLGMMGVSGFGIGGAANKYFLEKIEAKMKAGEAGYKLAKFGNQIVGVGKGAFGEPQLFGTIPTNLTAKQRQELIKNIMEFDPTEPVLSFEEKKAKYEQSPDSEALVSGGKQNIVQDASGKPVTTTDGKPVTTSAGQYADPALLAAQADAMKAAAQQDKAPTQPAPAPAPAPKPDPIDQNLYGDKGGDGDRGGDRGGSGQAGTGSGPGERFRATGGTVSFAEGGTTQKDPIQRTGFVEGPPQEYAKGTTVADTENLRVKEGSFVINAPITEKLQKAGVLPKGNQKRKAANGGKMMEVALSKGEYVVEPKDVPKFGGYNFLEAVNDMGKPEVERRQAAAGGGFIDGYAKGDRIKVYRGEPIDPSKAMTSTDYGYPKEDVGKFHTPLVERARNFASSAGPGNQLIRSRKVTVDELLDGVKEAFKVASRKKDNEYFKAMPKSELNKNLDYVDSLKKAYKSGERSLESFAFMLQEQVFHDESKIDFIETLKNDPKSAGKLAGRAIAKVATVATPPIAFLAGAAEMLTPSKLGKGTMFDDSFMTYTYTPTE